MTGTSLNVIAWRNLWRNRRRTLLTLSSIGFGVLLAVLATAMQDRNWDDLINLAARLGTGHVTLQHPEYLDAPTLSRTVTGTDRLRALAAEHPDVTRVVDRINGQTMLATARESYGAGFIAFDPSAEDTLTLSFLSSMVDGTMFRTSRDPGIILGERLARNLGASLGDKIVYTMTDRHGGMVSGLARITGLVRTGAPGLDAGLSLLPIDALRDVLDYGPNEATHVAVFADDQRHTDRLAARLAARIDGDVDVVPWHVNQRELAGFVAVKVGGARFMQLLIAVLVAAGIFNTLFVSVMERLREFGIMLAIGWSPGRLFRLVMLESAWLAVLGLVAAAALTAGPYVYLASNGIDLSAMMGEGTTDIAGVAMGSTLRVGIFPENLALIVVFAFLATLLAGLYPAWKAGRVDPIETIKLV